MRNTRNVDVKSLLQPCVVQVLSWVHIGTVISASKSPWLNSQEHVARCKLITISELKCLISHTTPNNWRMQKDFLLWRQTYGPIGLPKCVHETNILHRRRIFKRCTLLRHTYKWSREFNRSWCMSLPVDLSNFASYNHHRRSNDCCRCYRDWSFDTRCQLLKEQRHIYSERIWLRHFGKTYSVVRM